MALNLLPAVQLVKSSCTQLNTTYYSRAQTAWSNKTLCSSASRMRSVAAFSPSLGRPN